MWWPGTESNRRRQPFQGCALPTELPGRSGRKLSLANRSFPFQISLETDRSNIHYEKLQAQIQLFGPVFIRRCDGTLWRIC
jgi:hypothetical protein